MAEVTLRGIHKIYDNKVHVVKGIDLHIADGEFLVLVGPSGCGKSTVLRMVAGLEDISRGDILIGDRVVNNLHPKDRDVAMVFQSYALYPHMTVRENMGFGLKVRNMPAAEINAHIEEAAGILEITHLLDRLPKAMSGGQRQRVAMGRAIVRRPKVFLFDEPLSNLDAALRAQMRVELKTLHQRLGVTMIYVTHDQIEAMTLADRIVVLNQGIIQQVGSPLELYNMPANKFVAGFIGSPKMNFLNVKASGGKLEADGIAVADTGFDDARPCVLGVRPTDLEPAEEGEEPMFTATVKVTEPLGAEIIIHATVGAQELMLQWPSQQAAHLKPGDRLTLKTAPEVLHRFDAESGMRL